MGKEIVAEKSALVAAIGLPDMYGILQNVDMCQLYFFEL